MTPIQLLLVEDDPVFAGTLRKFLEDTKQYRVTISTNTTDALAALHREPVDVLVVDIKLEARVGTQDGESFAFQLRKDQRHYDRIPIVILTNYITVADAAHATREKEGTGIFYISKVANLEQRLAFIGNALFRWTQTGAAK